MTGFISPPDPAEKAAFSVACKNGRLICLQLCRRGRGSVSCPAFTVPIRRGRRIKSKCHRVYLRKHPSLPPPVTGRNFGESQTSKELDGEFLSSHSFLRLSSHPPRAEPAGGAVSAGLQLHCHVQTLVWALPLCLPPLCLPDSLKSHEWAGGEASAFHKSCTLLLRTC